MHVAKAILRHRMIQVDQLIMFTVVLKLEIQVEVIVAAYCCTVPLLHPIADDATIISSATVCSSMQRAS